MTCGLNRRIRATSGAAASSIGTSAKQPSGSGGSGSPSGGPEAANPGNAGRTPRISRARSISWTRICGSRSQTSGRSIAGFSTEPRSPPVQVATSPRAPSATYFAIVAAPLLDSSSGCAWTASSRNWSGSVTRPLSPAARRPWGPPRNNPLAGRTGASGRSPAATGPDLRAVRSTARRIRARPASPVLAWPDRPTAGPRSGTGPPSSQESRHVSSPTDEQSQGVWLTQEAHDRLKAELDQLVAGRPAMAAEINARREEGDLKENGGYHAAKDEQGKQEARIRQLPDLLRKATVGQAPTEVTNAATGTVITVRFAGDDDTEKFLLGSREIAGSTGLTVYSPESALGSAILGKAPGSSVTYQAPNGRDITVRVGAGEPFVP